jgi:hypothetical protein
MTTNRVNFTERHEKGGWAVYLPAISGFYTAQMSKMDRDPNFIGRPMPAGFEDLHYGLDYLNKDRGYYHYKWGLYSAGHAYLDTKKSDVEEAMVQKRDRNHTMILGDSGGFQIATGVIKLDWATVKGPGGDKLREQILRWLEHTSDWSMTLDVPAFAAVGNLSKKTGLKRFEDTLDITVHNLNYFIKNRVPGATKFLNVLSGSSPDTSKTWFDAVIPYSIPACVEGMGYEPERTLEGYAFAGINMKHMPSVLNRMIDLREINGFEGKDWIHFLGIGRLDWACYLTSIQRQLRKHYNPDITVSFDAASPYVATAYGLCYNYNSFDSKRLTYQMDKAVDQKDMKGSQLAMPFQSPIMDRLVVGDLCVLGDKDPNKNGKIGKTSWDTFSYCLYMSHNVYNHIQSVQEINRLADIEIIRKKITYKDWMRQKNSGVANEVSLFVPSTILYFDDFVRVLFDPATSIDDARLLISENNALLEHISFGGTRSDNKSVDKLNELFDVAAVNLVEIDQDALADSHNEATDAKLSELDALK